MNPQKPWRIDIERLDAASTEALRDLHLAAFGAEEGAEIVELIERLAADATAEPNESVVARDGDAIIGHALFTPATASGAAAPARILAPLAVTPSRWRQGVGAGLVHAAFDHLRTAGVGAVFVFGDPRYYSRFGFAAARLRGLIPPQPIAPEHADAFLAVELQRCALDGAAGCIGCARTLDEPRWW